MQRVRTFAPMVVGALLCTFAIFTLVQPAARGRNHHHHAQSWWKPPADVRAMLRDVSAQRLQATDHKLVSFGTRHTLSSQTDPARGVGAARDWIKSQFDAIAATSNGRITTGIDTFTQPVSDRVPVPTVISNPYAILHGSDPTSADAVYVVGAHYDSRRTDVLDGTGDAPGANDDGSGTSAVLELARVMAKHPTQATVVFVTYAGEEQGLYGSEHFAQMAKDKGWNIQGNLNMDIIGSSLGGNGEREPHTIRLFSEGVQTAETTDETARRQAIGGENDGESRQLARYIKEVGENRSTDMHVKLVWRRDRFLRSGDQVSYLKRHWAAVRFTEPNENFDHEHQDVRVENGTQFGDLEQFVDFPFLQRVTRVVGSSLLALSRSPRAPVNARMITTSLGYDTELRWNKNPESDVVGYEIVWRDSTAPLWTHSRRVGDDDHATIKNLLKDDVQVGVRAVDRDGNRSPVAYPKPAAS